MSSEFFEPARSLKSLSGTQRKCGFAVIYSTAMIPLLFMLFINGTHYFVRGLGMWVFLALLSIATFVAFFGGVFMFYVTGRLRWLLSTLIGLGVPFFLFAIAEGLAMANMH